MDVAQRFGQSSRSGFRRKTAWIGSANQIKGVDHWSSYYNSHAGTESYEFAVHLGPIGEVMGRRLFSQSHRQVYDLFVDWGWKDGPERGDGHLRMVKTIAGIDRTVQIMPPDRPGTGEKGNAIAIKTAARLMDMTVNQFLDGPQDDAARQKRIDRQDRVLKAAEERAHQQRVAAEAAAQNQEVPVGEYGKNNPKTGAMKALDDVFRANPNKRLPSAAWAAMFFQMHPEFVGVTDAARVGVYLSQAAKRTKTKKPGDWALHRTARGVYVWKQIPEETVAKQPIVPDPFPVLQGIERPEPVAGRGVPANITSGPISIIGNSLNGQTPDLLSKVHVLDGGRYLFQGDDGALYVVSGLARLDV